MIYDMIWKTDYVNTFATYILIYSQIDFYGGLFFSSEPKWANHCETVNDPNKSKKSGQRVESWKKQHAQPEIKEMKCPWYALRGKNKGSQFSWALY